jgi:hypothetical protein
VHTWTVSLGGGAIGVGYCLNKVNMEMPIMLGRIERDAMVFEDCVDDVGLVLSANRE